MAKKNLSAQQSNRLHDLSFLIFYYIRIVYPFVYTEYQENNGNPRKSVYALKDAIYETLKCLYIVSSDEQYENVVRLHEFLYGEKQRLGVLIQNKYHKEKINLHFQAINAITIQFENLIADAHVTLKRGL